MQSLCRLTIRNQIGSHRLDQIEKLSISNMETEGGGLAPYLIEFLEYRQLFLSVGQLPESNSWKDASHTSALKRVAKVVREVTIVNLFKKRNPMYIYEIRHDVRHVLNT